MGAGVTDKLWEIENIVALLVRAEIRIQGEPARWTSRDASLLGMFIITMIGVGYLWVR
jgi:hypothetical protein